METPAGGTAALENRLGRLHVLCRWFPRAGRASARRGGEDHDNRMDVRRSEAQCGRSEILHPTGHLQEGAFARGAQGTSRSAQHIKGFKPQSAREFNPFFALLGSEVRKCSVSLLSLYVGDKKRLQILQPRYTEMVRFRR